MLQNGTVPNFVEDGGYWVTNNSYQELVGRSVDDAINYLPDTVTQLTRAQLLARLTAMNLKAIDPATRQDVLLTPDQINTAMVNWLAALGMSDLA